MRNYIRYIVILVLIIAGGLLIISVVNRFTEPDTSKVDNSAKTEEKETKDTTNPTLDVEPTAPEEDQSSNESQVEETTPETDTTTTSDQDTQTTDTTTPSTDTQTTTETDNYNITVPDTGTEESIIFSILGLTIITGGIYFIRKNQLQSK